MYEAGHDLLSFSRATFPQVEGTPFITAWFHEIMVREIWEWHTSPECYFLMMFLPPRHGKSEIISRMLPAFLFGQDPDIRIFGTSYGQTLANDMSRDVQNIMLSDAYSQIFPNASLSKIGTRSETARRNIDQFNIVGRRGFYLGRGVGGGIMGKGADRIIIDDPFKSRKEAESETVRDSTWNWYKGTLRNRLQPGGKIILLNTRWYEDDLSGRILEYVKNEPNYDKWKVVSFPAIAEDSEHRHPEDDREDGEALWPEFYDIKALSKLEAASGTYDWSALFQQRPAPAGGALIKRDWLNVIDSPPMYLKWVRYWDLAVTKKTTADYTASGQMAMDRDGNVYVRNFVREQQEWPTTKRAIAIIAVQEQCPVGIEEVATQKGFVQSLLTEKSLSKIDLRGYGVDSDKKTRALPWIARAEAGKFYIVRGKGVDDYIDELVRFTGVEDKHDDQVDWTSGAYSMLAEYVEPEMVVIGEYEY